MLNPKKKRKECYFAGILAAAAAISLLSGSCHQPVIRLLWRYSVLRGSIKENGFL